MDYWFHAGPIPLNAISGHYDYYLVSLSYFIAVLASYVALDLAGQLQAETNPRSRIIWWLGGAFAMGAGIWSMHFIGMLAFIMPMPMIYDYFWTAASLLVAIFASGLALYLLKDRKRVLLYLISGGILIGLGIASMHYMGMYTMTDHVTIRYLPATFFLSIFIAVLAAEAALWLAFASNVGARRKQFYMKVFSALVMGIAICGMHYTGMAAAVFTPNAYTPHTTVAIDQTLLAYLIAIITTLIIAIPIITATSYRKMLTAVQNEKDFLNTLLHNLNDIIIACDNNGKITVCTHDLDKLKNKSILNKPLSKLNDLFDLRVINTIPIRPEEHPLHIALSGKHLHNEKYCFKHANRDEFRDVIIDGQPIFSANNKLGAVIVIHDVTDLNKAEKLKQEFVSIVSHELRTPLTSIKGALALLISKNFYDQPEKLEDLLNLAHKNTERLIRLINDILDVEKLEAGQMEFQMSEIDLVEIIHESILDVSTIAKHKNIKIIFNPPQSSIFINGNYDKLIQVMVNLLSNAIKFSPSDEKILVSIIDYLENVRVSVLDHGEGIPYEFQEKVFQKFSQASTRSSRTAGGTGFGLTITKSIIEKHGGCINFESTPRKGSCFYFELPKTPNKNINGSTTPIIASQSDVLICDSNPDAARFIKKYLLKNHIKADIALTIKEAKEKISRNAYKAILTNIILQEDDSRAFIREIRSNNVTKNIPVFVIATNIHKEKETMGVGFEIINWIEKPIRSEDLHKLVDYINTNFINTPRILLVEDDPDIQHLLRELMKSTAIIDASATLEEARTLLQTVAYDLIVLDLKLPDGLGTDLLPVENPKTGELIPVVIFSAFDLDPKYMHLVKEVLQKTKVSNERLFYIINKILKSE